MVHHLSVTYCSIGAGLWSKNSSTQKQYVCRFSSFREFKVFGFFSLLCTETLENKIQKIPTLLLLFVQPCLVLGQCETIQFSWSENINICEMFRYCDERDPVSTQTDVSATSGSRFHGPVRGLALISLFNYLLAKGCVSFLLISHNPTEIPSGKNIR